MEAEYRGFKIVPDGTFGMKFIKPTSRGSVPKALRGSFTNVYMAQKIIDQHLGQKGKAVDEETSAG